MVLRGEVHLEKRISRVPPITRQTPRRIFLFGLSPPLRKKEEIMIVSSGYVLVKGTTMKARLNCKALYRKAIARVLLTPTAKKRAMAR